MNGIGSPELPPDVDELKAAKDFQALGRALFYEEDEEVRIAAAEALGELGTRQAVEALIWALKECRAVWEYKVDNGGKQLSVERYLGSVAEALGIIEGGVEAAVEELLEYLTWDSSKVDIDEYRESEYEFRRRWEDERRWTAGAFKALGSPAIRATLEAVREGAKIAHAGSILGAAKSEDVEVLLEFFKGPKGGVPGVILAEAFGSIGDQRAVELIKPLLEYSSDDVRRIAGTALKRLGWKPKTDGEQALLYIALHEWKLAASLGKAAVPALERALHTPYLIHRYYDWGRTMPWVNIPSDQPRIDAIVALAHIGEPAIDALIEALELVFSGLGDIQYGPANDAHYTIKVTLVSIGEPAVEKLLEAVERSDFETAQYFGLAGALLSIAQKHEIKDKDLENRLIEFVVKTVVIEPTQFDMDFTNICEKMVPHLIRGLAVLDADVHESVAWYLGMEGSARPTVSEMLDYVGKTFEISADIVEALLGLVREDEGWLETEGVYPSIELVLSKVSDERAIEQLVEASKDENETVRRVATRALETIQEDPESE